MRKLGYLVGVAALAVVASVATAEAATIYVTGNVCPEDPIAPYTRQYSVTQASMCMYDPASDNITGTNADAAAYLNTPGALAEGWGAGWVGLGKTDNPGGIPIANFTWSSDIGNDDGTYTIGAPLLATYSRFALAVKDGDTPKWALFFLTAASGDWHFLTQQGDLSHLSLFAAVGGTPGTFAAVPEPASLFLLGSGLFFGARRIRKFRS